MRLTLLLATAGLTFGLLSVSAAEADWTEVSGELGNSGTEMLGSVYRVSLPRTDLHVIVDGAIP